MANEKETAVPQERPKISPTDPAAIMAQLLLELREQNKSNPFNTPEGMRTFLEEMKKPYVDPVAEARLKRDRNENLAQLERQREAIRINQEKCSHVDRMGHSKFYTVHNFVDGAVRGLCVECRKLVEPGDALYNFILQRDRDLNADAPAVSGYM